MKNPYPHNRIRDYDIFEHFFKDTWPQERIGRHIDVFDEFDEQFKRMQQRMNNLLRGTIQGNNELLQSTNPKVYGWTYKVGTDGKPIFQEFGNIPRSPLSKPEETLGSREPLVDIQEDDKKITIIAEIPGVSKEDIDLEVANDSIKISVDTVERKYFKEVNLQTEVDQNYADAKFNNGVLSIILKKLKPKKKGKKLKIN